MISPSIAPWTHTQILFCDEGSYYLSLLISEKIETPPPQKKSLVQFPTVYSKEQLKATFLTLSSFQILGLLCLSFKE